MQPSDVTAVLADLADLHERKSHDYAQDSNPFSNFEEAAASAGVSVDTVFAVMMAIKQARLKELQQAAKTPKHESIADTQIDLALYGVLRAAYARRAARVSDDEQDYSYAV
jgi:hypothetical protein